MRKDPEISVVIPVYNEQESIGELAALLKKSLATLPFSWEVIVCDDGSQDATFDRYLQETHGDDRFKCISFRKNFGKSMALSAGFHYSQGEIIITMDGDLQDRPDEIPKLLEKLNEGYDLVSGWKQKRHDPYSKRLPSKIFNLTVSLLTGVKIHDFNCGLKIYRRSVVESLNLYGDLYRFIPALAAWQGFRVGEIPVQHSPRKYGKSKYGASRLVRAVFDLCTILFLIKYATRPLHFFGLVGFITFLFGFVIGIYLTVQKFQGHPIGHRPLLVLAVLLMVLGVQFFSTGLIAEMLTNITREKNTRFQIRKKIGNFGNVR